MANNVFNPKISVPLTTARPDPSVNSKVTTFILQMTSGTATAGELIEDIDVNSENGLFGADSAIATAIREFRKINSVSQINAIPVADAGGATASTGSVVFAGTATASGSIDVYIGNKDRKYEVVISVGDTATTVGSALEALITADTSALASGVNTTGSVALTAVNAGTQGDDIGIRVDGSVAGITATLTAMSGGAGDPVMTGLDALLVERTDIIIHSQYDYDLFVTMLDGRFNSDNIPLDGRLFFSLTDTKANLVTLADAENSQSLVIVGDKPVDKSAKKGSAIFAMPYQKVAELQAIRTLRLEDGQVITDWVQTRASRDQFGGPALNSLPLFNSPLLLPVVPTAEGFTSAEVADLETSGVSVFGNNSAKNTLITGTIVTTYKTDTVGNDDLTYKYLEYVDTATASREYIMSALRIDYSQARLSKGSTINGRDIATVGRVRSDFMSYMAELGGEDYVLLQWGLVDETGEQVSEIVNRNLDISLEPDEGKIFVDSILPIMTQTREILAPLQIVFDVTKF